MDQPACPSRGRIRRVGARYVVSASTLPLLQSKASTALLAQSDSIYAVVQRHCIDAQDKPILVSVISGATALSIDDASSALEAMTDVPVRWSRTSKETRSRSLGKSRTW